MGFTRTLTLSELAESYTRLSDIVPTLPPLVGAVITNAGTSDLYMSCVGGANDTPTDQFAIVLAAGQQATLDRIVAALTHIKAETSAGSVIEIIGTQDT